MIVTRTPLRISLVGGGTDLPAFYNYHPGAVISMAIDKYIYIMLNPKFDGRIRVSYSKTENVDNWIDVKHEIVREVGKLFSLGGMEVVSVSDIPGDGSGLGSSSAFTVGLIRAVWEQIKFKGTPGGLAKCAFMVESTLCGHPVGKQDHYAAAYGGMSHIQFAKGRVVVSPFSFLDEEWASIHMRMMLFWTGVSRSSGEILTGQQDSLQKDNRAFERGLLMAELTDELAGTFRSDFTMGLFQLGRSVKVNWSLKKTLGDGISEPWIDGLVEKSIEAGADGAKICGAGGGGFFLVIAEPDKHEAIEAALNLRRVPFNIKAKGSTVLHTEE
jgi:D-glycero-alpha-D-manno-heptose-7-phosphate kinase